MIAFNKSGAANSSRLGIHPRIPLVWVNKSLRRIRSSLNSGIKSLRGSVKLSFPSSFSFKKTLVVPNTLVKLAKS